MLVVSNDYHGTTSAHKTKHAGNVAATSSTDKLYGEPPPPTTIPRRHLASNVWGMKHDRQGHRRCHGLNLFLLDSELTACPLLPQGHPPPWLSTQQAAV